MKCRIRPYQPADRETVRSICADTGCMGDPIDRVFSDRDAFADFFTRYYTDCEPESAFVAENGETGQVVGYLLGCRRHKSQPWRANWLLVTRIIPKVVWRFLTGRYDRGSRRFLYWVVFKSIRETPSAPKNAAHFHVNLLPDYRHGPFGRGLVFSFFRLLKKCGEPRVYGQIQTRDDRRTEFFKRYGFREFSRKRITKFQHLETEPIYVSTLFRDSSERG